ncbi:MAG: hypothetical protein ACOC2Z_06555, partial [Coleofasciculus sp.]
PLHLWDAIAVENLVGFVIPFPVGIRAGFICRGGFRDKLNPQTNNLSPKPAQPHPTATSLACDRGLNFNSLLK